MKDFEESDKMAMLYIIHFGNKNPEFVTCKDCLDFRQGFCSGGADDVFECMYDKVEGCEFISRIYF